MQTHLRAFISVSCAETFLQGVYPRQASQSHGQFPRVRTDSLSRRWEPSSYHCNHTLNAAPATSPGLASSLPSAEPLAFSWLLLTPLLTPALSFNSCPQPADTARVTVCTLIIVVPISGSSCIFRLWALSGLRQPGEGEMREISAYFALGEPTEGGAGRISQGAGGEGSLGSDLAAFFASGAALLPFLILSYAQSQLSHPHTTNFCGFICKKVCVYVHTHMHCGHTPPC